MTSSFVNINICPSVREQQMPLSACPDVFPPSVYEPRRCAPLRCLPYRQCFDSLVSDIQECIPSRLWCTCVDRIAPSFFGPVSTSPSPPTTPSNLPAVDGFFTFQPFRPTGMSMTTEAPPLPATSTTTAARLVTSTTQRAFSAMTGGVENNSDNVFVSSPSSVTSGSGAPSTMSSASDESTSAIMGDSPMEPAVIIVIILLSLLTVFLVAVGVMFAYRYVKNRRKNHGVYKPQLEETKAHDKNPDSYVPPPDHPEGLI